MLINLSNHPISIWSEKQLKAAKQQWGQLCDLPFPRIEPENELQQVSQIAKEYVEKCTKLFQSQNPELNGIKLGCHAVHVMGEMTFVYQFVQKMSEQGVLCLASTTRRVVSMDDNGLKTSQFEFVRFRQYTEELF